MADTLVVFPMQNRKSLVTEVVYRVARRLRPKPVGVDEDGKRSHIIQTFKLELIICRL